MAQLLSPTPFAGQCLPPHIAGEKPTILKRILSPGINLSLWQRDSQPEIADELAPLKASSLSDARLDTSPSTFDNDICALLRERNLDPQAFQCWRKDLRRIADIYFEISHGRKVTMRLETSDSTQCPRFHVDRTHLRLLCTYRGEATEWLSEVQSDRQAQANGATNEDIIRFGEPSSFGPFSVGVMKGSAYPNNAELGLLHRSPAVEGSNRTRVLFCLDS